jgi:hypothetical protein
MARPKLLKEEIRSKEVKVRFSLEEYNRLIDVMDECGHDSPASFLRISGIRSKVPKKIFIPETDKLLMKHIANLINEIKDELLVRDSSDLKNVASMLASIVKLMREINYTFIRAVKLREQQEAE